MSTGVELRDAGMALVIENAPLDYKTEIAKSLDWLIGLDVPFTADDVRDMVPAHLTGHPNVLPALLGSRARNGRIVPVGRYRTTRRTRHSSKNQVWRAA